MKILAVVDFPLVPVMVYFYFYKMNKKHLNQYKFYDKFFFKNLDNLQFKISIPGLIIILSNLVLITFDL